MAYVAGYTFWLHFSDWNKQIFCSREASGARVKVRLSLRVRLPNGKRLFVAPVYAASGKLKPLYAIVSGKPEHHPEGVYHLRYLSISSSSSRKPSCFIWRRKRKALIREI